MKILKIAIITTIAINLPACTDKLIKQSDVLGGGEYLESYKGEIVFNCYGKYISTKHKPSEADEFWKENNLPKGTNHFVCKDDKPYLPNKVTDCQGNLIYKMEGIDGFRKKYNLNRGNIRFRCNGNTVIPVPLSELQ